MPIVPTIIGVMHINFKAGGWSERYVLKDATSPAEGLLTMQAIVYGRSAFFGLGVECVHARCSVAGPGPDRRVCDLPYPIGPHPQFSAAGPAGPNSAPNDRGTAAQMYFETAAGQWGNRYFRCMPDHWISDMRLAVGIRPYYQMAPVAPAAADLGPAGGPSHLAICQGFWAFLRANTALPKKISAVEYNNRPLANIGFAQITTKKMGRPFRMSVGRRPALLIG